SSSADEIEIATKDRSGADYGDVTQTITLEGNITEGDPFPKYIIKAQRNTEYVKIYEVNTRDLTAEYGRSMITAFDKDYSNGDLSKYSRGRTLFGDISVTELTALPESAPALEGMECEAITEIDNGDGGGVEG